MKYMGSKNRIAKDILPIMLDAAKSRNITKWVEPFVGGANMIDKVPKSFERIGADINPHTIAALIGIRDCLDEFPNEVSEEHYKSLKGTDPNCITSWIRFVASFGGKFENGYARESSSDDSTFVGYGKRNAIKQSPNIQSVSFICVDYTHFSDYENCIIYCDIPYKGTTSYKTAKFDHELFWEWCRKMSKNNLVYISEYTAPSDFTCVWEGNVKTNFASDRKKAIVATEKLFTI